MQLDEKDKGYLWDIEDACKDILDFIQNTTHHEFINDKMKKLVALCINFYFDNTSSLI